RSSRPTGSGGIGSAQGAQRPSTGRAPRIGRPSARALEPADGVWGHRKRAGRAAPEHWTGPQNREAERESAWAGRRGLGASEAREEWTGSQNREAERESAWAGRRGLGASEARRARSARALDGPPESGGRARERLGRPTGSGGIGSAQGAQRPSTGRAPRII